LSDVDDNRNPAYVVQAIHRWAWSYDSGDVDAAAECFTDDGELEMGGNRWTGRDAIRSAYAESRTARSAAGQQPRHLITNVLVREQSETEAVATSWLSAHLDEGRDLRRHRDGRRATREGACRPSRYEKPGVGRGRLRAQLTTEARPRAPH
jgi:hypothetical protein